MKVLSAILLCVALLALLIRPPWRTQAAATQSSHAGIAQSASSMLPSDPAIAQNADGRLEVFDRGPNGSVFHSWQQSPGGAWSNWTQLDSGILLNNLAVGVNTDGRLEVFGMGLDEGLWHDWQECAGCGWSGWFSLEGGLLSPPVVGRNADGRLEVFAAGRDTAVWTTSQTCAGCGWTAWSSLGGELTSSPAVGQAPGGQLQIFGRGVDGAVWTKMADERVRKLVIQLDVARRLDNKHAHHLGMAEWIDGCLRARCGWRALDDGNLSWMRLVWLVPARGRHCR
jgi:hypothetical protein